MTAPLQIGSLMKRFSAFLLDFILLVILITGFVGLLAMAFDYDSYSQTVEDAMAKYEAQYGVSFDITQEEYEQLAPERKQEYDDAFLALNSDQEAVHAQKTANSLILMNATLSALLAYLILEFIVPLILKNGQTLGKKVFSLGLVRNDGVKMNNMQLFVRTFLGKYTLGTMLPVYLVIMILQGQIGLLGTVLLVILGITQLILILSRDHAPLQDRMAGTVLVDISCQQVFESTEELIAYTKRIHAERAERQSY